MRRWVILACCVALAACATVPPAAPPSALFRDELFAPASEPVDATDVFAFSPAMQHYLDTEVARRAHAKGSRQALLDALYAEHQLKLAYDTAMTRNAAQAFDARSGNCLSLVIMTAAFAKQMGLPVQYQSVLVDETWSRSGDLYFASGHVNLTLGRRAIDAHLGFDASELLTVDFLPPEDVRGQRARFITEDTVIAMYMNNRAAEFLAQARLDDAYWWARAAIRQAPTFLSSYNTLGVIYRRHGNPAEAERLLEHVLAIEPANTLVMSNLVQVLADLGRNAEAGALARKVAQIEPYPPFHFFNLGLAAMKDGNYRAARDYFAKEVERAAYYHEFHFWLALADYRLGDLRQAREHLVIAMENSATRQDHDLYAAKLDWLKFHRTQ